MMSLLSNVTTTNKISQPWFASYVDITATPRYAFEKSGTNSSQKNVVLSFVVSSPTDTCVPTWGGVYSMDDARVELDLDRRIARLRQQGGNVAISFGRCILNADNCLASCQIDRSTGNVTTIGGNRNRRSISHNFSISVGNGKYKSCWCVVSAWERSK